MLECKVALKSLFASGEWENHSLSKKREGIRCHDIVFNKNFWAFVVFSLKSTMPLIKVLRLVDAASIPSMGYIYEVMDQAKEAIARILGDVESRYKPIWNKIDDRWASHLQHSLHCAGYYLNPKFHYSENFNHDNLEVKIGLYDTLDRLVENQAERVKMDNELVTFINAKGMFSRSTTIERKITLQPAIWWEDYGDSAPLLKKVAIRILSLTCSASGWERNWSVFEQELYSCDWI